MRLLSKLFPDQQVEFLCEQEDWEVIPVPYPARKLMPDWYKHLPAKIGKMDKLNNSTIRRCAPFLDAMSVGWIIPLAADVEIITNADASGVDYKWSFHKSMVENHSAEQLNAPNAPKHPTSPKPPLKFMNYWYIKMPPGYSALFVPPLNRPDARFQCISGLVDDTYMGNGAIERINFPFTFNVPNYTGLIKAGTPLVQMIPIKRDEVLKSSRDTIINKMSAKDLQLLEKTRARRRSHESLYRDKLWSRK